MNRIKKFATTLAVAVSALAGAMAVSSPASAAGWVWGNRNNDGYYDIAGLDANNDGIFEEIYYDADFNTTWDLYMRVDGAWVYYYVFSSRYQLWTYQAGAAKYSYVDAAGDGRIEQLLYDANSDGAAEWYIGDTNGDGWYDGGWIQIARPAPISNNSSTRLLLNYLTMAHNNAMVSIWLR